MENKTTHIYGIKDYLRHLFRELRPYRWHAFAAAGLAMFQAAFFLAFPFILQSIMDNAIGKGDFGLLARLLSLLTIGFILSALGAVGHDYLAARTAAGLLADLRERMYARLQGLTPIFFHRISGGDLLSRFSNDLNIMEQALVRMLGNGLYNIILIAGSIFLLFFIEWRLASFTCAGLSLAYIVPKYFGRRAGYFSSRRKQEEGELMEALQESIAGRDIIRGYGLEEIMGMRMRSHLERLRSNSITTLYYSSLLGRTGNLIVFFMILLIIGAGAYFTLNGWLTIGTLFAFLAMLANLGDAGVAIADIAPAAVQASSGAQRVEQLLMENGHEDPAYTGAELSPSWKTIEFRSVSFGYRHDKPNLYDINLVIRRGEAIAIIGTSGSGKSTMLRLLTRTYHPQSGHIRFGGQDIREVSCSSLCRQIAVVPQEPFLFNASIRDNIRYGRLDAGDGEIEAAAHSAELEDVIAVLPDGYETLAGEGGRSLSVGQRQRVALARAILRNPAVLLLDEVTSALDPAAEAAINLTLDRLRGDYTVVNVTHRIASAAHMDRIIVLDKQRIAETGSHRELLALNGVYSRLWQKQSGFDFSPDGRWVTVEKNKLRTIPLLAQLTDPLLEELVRHFSTLHLDAEVNIITEGQTSESFYIIADGSFRVLQGGPGKEHQVNILEAGDYFGEISLIHRIPASATVRSRTACVCLVLSAEPFHRLLAGAPDVRERVYNLAAQRMAAGYGAETKEKD